MSNADIAMRDTMSIFPEVTLSPVPFDSTSAGLTGRQHDLEYYFEDGSVIVLVENVLFRVHKTILSKDSSTFETMFSIPGKQVEGTDDEHPVILKGDTPGQFRSLLWALYALPHEIVEASTTGPDWSAFDTFYDLAQIAHKYNFHSLEIWALTTFLNWLNPGMRLTPPKISPITTVGNVTSSSSTATSALPSSTGPGRSPTADKSLLDRLRRILELAVLCDEKTLHAAVVRRLQDELYQADADLPWFIMLGENYGISSLLGTSYYTLMIQGQGRWIALTKERTLSSSQLAKLHNGFYALVSLWEKYRTMPPVIPACTHYGHNCRQRWQTYWKDLTKDDHIMAKFPADVLGRLEMVLSQLYSYTGIMDMHQECRSRAVAAVRRMHSEAKTSLASNFMELP